MSKPFGKRREFALHELPPVHVIQYMWEQGVHLVIEKGLFFWVERKHV